MRTRRSTDVASDIAVRESATVVPRPRHGSAASCRRGRWRRDDGDRRGCGGGLIAAGGARPSVRGWRSQKRASQRQVRYWCFLMEVVVVFNGGGGVCLGNRRWQATGRTR
ncbi:putative serine/arginine-rich splicing factor SR45 isoform X2 [Iris pallida]|uniref:Serine/arginine-rich splicing factor SR45 isoform X2 n=1 Tax=Iris pallida TaxID=29817 RepID=A0AAX6H2C3_IRIPA|nr:putative serine/arginine-rich splicing factor SR45 isoform X2 [Iris pallida]